MLKRNLRHRGCGGVVSELGGLATCERCGETIKSPLEVVDGKEE